METKTGKNTPTPTHRRWPGRGEGGGRQLIGKTRHKHPGETEIYPWHRCWYAQSCTAPAHTITALSIVVQSRFGDKALKNPSASSPKRDSSTRTVITRHRCRSESCKPEIRITCVALCPHPVVYRQRTVESIAGVVRGLPLEEHSSNRAKDAAVIRETNEKNHTTTWEQHEAWQ